MSNDPRDHRGTSGGPLRAVPAALPQSAATGAAAGPIIRDHRGQPSEGVPPGSGGSGWGDGVVRDHRKSALKHVFVLMLENRSFDHMLGLSGITGTDAATGQPTRVEGLRGDEYNMLGQTKYTVTRGAPDVMKHGPGHNFSDVVEQLCGAGATYAPGGAYPPVTNGGFVE